MDFVAAQVGRGCHRHRPQFESTGQIERAGAGELPVLYHAIHFFEGQAVYEAFAEQVRETKRKFLEFLIQAKRENKQVIAYGAPGKGNTLLNYCGVRTDFIDYTVDRNPYKHYKYLPGTHIPVYPPEWIELTKPEYIVILPWNAG